MVVEVIMPMDAAAGRTGLDQIAQKEYLTSFEKAIDVPDELLKVRRIARMAGIELKRPFADPKPISRPSVTGALQEWELKADLRGGNPAFHLYEKEPSYHIQLAVYETLKANPQLIPPNVHVETFGIFFETSHSESSWLLALLKAAQPYLCENTGAVVKHPTSHEQKEKFWKTVAEAAGELANKGTEKAVESVAVSLSTLVPFLSAATAPLVFGVTFILVHYAKKQYCSTAIQEQIVQTLGLSDQYQQ
jgi:hypothetical protein